MVYPDYQAVEQGEVRQMFEAFWGQKLDPKNGLTVVEIMRAIHAGEVVSEVKTQTRPPSRASESGIGVHFQRILAGVSARPARCTRTEHADRRFEPVHHSTSRGGSPPRPENAYAICFVSRA